MVLPGAFFLVAFFPFLLGQLKLVIDVFSLFSRRSIPIRLPSVDGHAPTRSVDSLHSPIPTRSVDGHIPTRSIDGHIPTRSVDGHVPTRSIDGHIPKRSIDGHLPTRSVDSLHTPLVDGHLQTPLPPRSVDSLHTSLPPRSVDGHAQTPTRSIDGHGQTRTPTRPIVIDATAEWKDERRRRSFAGRQEAVVRLPFFLFFLHSLSSSLPLSYALSVLGRYPSFSPSPSPPPSPFRRLLTLAMLVLI